MLSPLYRVLERNLACPSLRTHPQQGTVNRSNGRQHLPRFEPRPAQSSSKLRARTKATMSSE
ncbi:hypothetical protein TSOC_002619 [Tetrabaena socialis]|uniref:Uncharacterized protein n=1 Tax=Tetrabaena socialis TaxID=47790 RepID=A0A2J8ADN2_9CHLO|nr:hypothetical protein TSOC_002619 [Tetrabaena socialis]|eukprot:PNH10627.1 hypothetical protein TSOC_002619 [Tetrabaena socialis]